MRVKEAALRAKQHIADLFEEEGVQNIGLEEISFDDNTGTWGVTVGFSRPWDHLEERPRMSLPPSVAELLDSNRKWIREMKVVTINDSNGEAMAVRNRE